ncbi:MAG: hypothetical protein ACRYFU_02450 [Janthinobacterium lividum]
MNDWTKRVALAGLVGFLVFFFALPVSCSGLVLYNDHLYGDAQSSGPDAILQAMGVAAILALLSAALVWRRSRPR